MAVVVKNLPANAGDIEMWVRFLGGEDPLEDGKTTHSKILAWRIPSEESVSWNTLVMPRNFYWLRAARLLLLREKWWWGRVPRKVRGVDENIKQTLVLGGRCSGTGGFLRFDHALAYAKPPSSWPLPWAEFLTLASGNQDLSWRQRWICKTLCN